MTQTNAAERVRQLQAEAQAEIQQIDDRMAECRKRIYQLAQNGVVSADEARQQFDQALAPMIADGERQITRHLEAFTRPRLSPDLSGVISGLHFRAGPSLHGLLDTSRDSDIGPVLACLFADQLRDRFEAVIDEACSGDTLPPPAKRAKEIESLADELKQLAAERDELQDELARAFNFRPSDATLARERRDLEQSQIDALNRATSD